MYNPVLYFISISTLSYFGFCLAIGYTVGGARGFDGIMMIQRGFAGVYSVLRWASE